MQDFKVSLRFVILGVVVALATFLLMYQQGFVDGVEVSKCNIYWKEIIPGDTLQLVRLLPECIDFYLKE